MFVMRLVGRGTTVLLSVLVLAAAGCGSPTAPQAGRLVSGDGAYPVQLPDGRRAWLFGDSLVRTPGGRDRLVHSGIVVRSASGGTAATVVGGTPDQPADLIPSGTPQRVIWPAAGFVEDGQLQVFAEEISIAGGGFHSTGRRFQVTLSLPDLRVTARSEVYGGEISWGHAVLVQGNDVYVYGNHEIDGWTNTTYLARFTLGASRGPWRFWDGERFQMSPLRAAPLEGPDGRSQVAKLASVLGGTGGIAAFTIDPCGTTIDVRVATQPWGPFSAKRSVYSIPERNPYLPRAYQDGDQIRIAYSIPQAMPRTVRVSADAAPAFTTDDRIPRHCTAEW
jgi:hypothetical protein